ncbi:MAG: BatA and WFA domain-containing protein [Candidatus Poribacteria bacterium]|nr:BatA and WFA domain-containing protein [Candidatus Poribacteria bacterium]
MQFLNPAAFYLLGVIPIVVALHFLKLRRHTRLVPSIMLWLSTDEDRRANVPFQRLRNLLLPLLQVLFLVLLTCSIARPALYKPGFMPGKVILIVDNSASMLSTEMGEIRLTLAKQEAQRYIKEVSASGGMMLMTTNAPGTYIQQAFTTDTAKLHRAVENITSTHTPRNLRPVFDAATRYAESPQDKVVFISDTFENLPDISLPVHKIGVGRKADNVGIIRFSVEVVGNRYEVLVGIQNFTDMSKEFDVRLAVENVFLDDRTVSIRPGKTRSILFSDDSSGLEGKVMGIHLDIEDDFASDNSASAILSAVPPLHILLISDNRNSLLPMLLEAYGDHIKLDLVDPVDYHGTVDADLIIFDGSTPAGRDALGDFSEVDSETHLIFIAPGSNLPLILDDVSAVEMVSTPTRVIKEDEGHPLMVGVSLQGVLVKESWHRELPLWGDALVETEKGALIWTGQKSDNQRLVFEFDAFNPKISDFALTIPAAPQFVYQCLAWFEAGTAPLQPLLFQEGKTRHAFRTGEQVKVGLTREGRTLHVQKPDKTMVELDNPIFTQTDQIGVYTLLADNIELERFTVNLLNAKESALPHSLGSTIPEDSTDTEAGLQPIAQEIWRWFAFTACLFLLVEWWFYHRNSL